MTGSHERICQQDVNDANIRCLVHKLRHGYLVFFPCLPFPLPLLLLLPVIAAGWNRTHAACQVLLTGNGLRASKVCDLKACRR